MKIFIVSALQRKQIAEIKAFGIRDELNLSWAIGMIGVMPVFDNKKQAEIYADGKYEILEAEIKEAE